MILAMKQLTREIALIDWEFWIRFDHYLNNQDNAEAEAKANALGAQLDALKARLSAMQAIDLAYTSYEA